MPSNTFLYGTDEELPLGAMLFVGFFLIIGLLIDLFKDKEAEERRREERLLYLQQVRDGNTNF